MSAKKTSTIVSLLTVAVILEIIAVSLKAPDTVVQGFAPAQKLHQFAMFLVYVSFVGAVAAYATN